MTIEQPDGAGSGSPSLDNAWLGVPVIITGGAVAVLDASSGTTVAVSAASASGATLTATGLPGGARVDIGGTVRVILWTCDSDGNVLAPAIPALLGEAPGERNGSRSYATAHETLLRAFGSAAADVAAAQAAFEADINATVDAAVDEVADLSEQVAAFDARVDALENPVTATPADAVGVVFWGKGISDPTLRTMTGNRLDSLINGIDNGLVMTRRAGTPIIDTTVSRNGHNPLRMDATTEIKVDTGGPAGNQSFGIMLLTDGSDATAFTGFCRAGALSAAGGVGLTTSGRFGSGLVGGVGQPIAAAPEPLADGTLRIVGTQNLPQYGRIACTVDSRYPQPASGAAWNYTGYSPLTLDGSIALGKIETGGVVNLSGVYDFVVWVGELSAADRAMIAAYWCERFSKALTAPGLYITGDSNSVASPGANATTTWPDRLATLLAAQLALDGRTMPVFRNTALSGKYAGGAWALQGTTSPTCAYQSDGNYVAWTDSVNPGQGIQYSAAKSRSGCREYEIALVMAGTNDLISEGVSGDEMIARLKYICATLRDMGYYVVLQTIIAGSSSFYTTPKEAARVAANAWIVASAVSEGYARRIVNHSNLAFNATNYGADALHPNDVGQAIMAANVFAVVEPAIREDLAA